jgi:hypothetical protein
MRIISKNRPDTFTQTNCSLAGFLLQSGGGPYNITSNRPPRFSEAIRPGSEPRLQAKALSLSISSRQFHRAKSLGSLRGSVSVATGCRARSKVLENRRARLTQQDYAVWYIKSKQVNLAVKVLILGRCQVWRPQGLEKPSSSKGNAGGPEAIKRIYKRHIWISSAKRSLTGNSIP